ncbi:MAG: IS1634 family transposase [Arenicellales bacterium]|jgi:transposase|nr:IS1634 family transposase [Arenicellales bacterium]
MFIKRVTKTNGKTKTKYSYLYLVESVRTENGPRQRLILNLGDLQIDRSQWTALARRIEDILVGRRSLFDLDQNIEQHARRAANKIFEKRAEEINDERPDDFQLVNTKTLEVSRPRSLGAEYVCHSIWKQLDFDAVLRRQGISEHVLPLLEALVVSRLIEARSERWTKRWVEDLSALYEMTGTPLRHSLQSYYRGTDALYECREALEGHLADREKDLFSLEESIVLYDLTNTYFEGRSAGNPKAAYGKSKERRSDCKLATMGLIVDDAGFAKYSKIYPGNQYEADTFQQIIGELEQQLRVKTKATIVLDAGVATKENIGWLDEHGYHYIVVNRGKAPFEMSFEDMSIIKEDEQKGVKIEVKRYERQGTAYILVKSEQKRLKEASMMGRVEQLLLDRLQYYRSGLGKKNHVKKYPKVMEMVGRLKEKYSRAAQLYEIVVIPDKNGDKDAVNAVDIRWQRKEPRYDEQTKSEGTYILRTNRCDLTDQQIWQTYIMLGHIETAFKDMKSHLGLRPNFHQKGQRVDAHMFISVLAYHLMHAIEHKLRLAGDSRSWWTIKTTLRSHERITIEYISKDDDGARFHNTVRVNSRVEPEHLEIYTKLGLSGEPLQRKRVTRKIGSDHTPKLTPPAAVT